MSCCGFFWTKRNRRKQVKHVRNRQSKIRRDYESDASSSTRPQMPISDRAAQFSPFAALTGYAGVIRETARLTDRKIELDETMLTALNERYRLLLSVLDTEPEVEITYFVPDERKSGGAYRTVSGVVKKADEFARRLTLTDGTVIPMEDVLMLDGAIFGQNE